MADKPFVHTVHQTFHMHTPQETIRELLESFQNLNEACGGSEAGILFWKVGLNTYRSKKSSEQKPVKRVDMVQVAIFKSDAAFQRFRADPAHVALKEKLKMHADWEPGDLDLTSADIVNLQAIQAS